MSIGLFAVTLCIRIKSDYSSLIILESKNMEKLLSMIGLVQLHLESIIKD
jgi:hypothetical protein